MNYEDFGKKPQPKTTDPSSGETLVWAGITALFFPPLGIALAALSGALYVVEKVEEQN